MAHQARVIAITFLVLAGAISWVACSAAHSGLAPQQCPLTGIDPTSLVATVEQPKPIELFTPPLPIPTAVAGQRATIRLVVDTAGAVMRDSIMVCGLSDAAYTRRVAELVAAVRFAPRRVGGRPVNSPALLVYSF